MNYADYAERYLVEHLACLRALPLDSIEQAMEVLWEAYERDATVFLCGNGGSASMAAHFAADLSKTTLRPDLFNEVKRFRAISLSDNIALLTAWGNDVAYERVFAEQLRNLAHPGDVLFAISGSGTSPNIVAAIETARDLDVTVIGLTGRSGGSLRYDSDICISVDTDAYEHNEPLHSVVFHLVTFYLRERIAAQASNPQYSLQLTS